MQLLGGIDNLALSIFNFFCLNMDKSNKIKCTYKTLKELFPKKGRQSFLDAIDELYEFGFIDKKLKGRTNIYHVNKNLAWRLSNSEKESFKQNTDMYIKFEQFQKNNEVEIKKIKKIQNRLAKEITALT